jgi:hypothetical protein
MSARQEFVKYLDRNKKAIVPAAIMRASHHRRRGRVVVE